jgi:hypothetical protein
LTAITKTGPPSLWTWGLLSLALACSSDRAAAPRPSPSTEASLSGLITPEKAVGELGKNDFQSYWHMGLAEMNRYELRQSRYGELHDGEAVLVFVAEDFLADRQVKYEHGDKTHVVPILKLNAYRRFRTGVYPYTLLTSVFSPIATINEPIKVSASVQEWCGQAYFQLNRQDDQYRTVAHSYFQDEGDRSLNIPAAQLEDGLWAQARRDPSQLPTGHLDVVPAIHYLRLMHKELEAMPATASLTTTDGSADGSGRLVYRLSYDSGDRILVMTIERAFPHRILAWEETGPSLFSEAPLTTTAVLTNSIMLDYWNRHKVEDAPYREALGLVF